MNFPDIEKEFLEYWNDTIAEISFSHNIFKYRVDVHLKHAFFYSPMQYTFKYIVVNQISDTHYAITSNTEIHIMTALNLIVYNQNLNNFLSELCLFLNLTRVFNSASSENSSYTTKSDATMVIIYGIYLHEYIRYFIDRYRDYRYRLRVCEHKYMGNDDLFAILFVDVSDAFEPISSLLSNTGKRKIHKRIYSNMMENIYNASSDVISLIKAILEETGFSIEDTRKYVRDHQILQTHTVYELIDQVTRTVDQCKNCNTGIFENSPECSILHYINPPSTETKNGKKRIKKRVKPIVKSNAFFRKANFELILFTFLNFEINGNVEYNLSHYTANNIILHRLTHTTHINNIFPTALKEIQSFVTNKNRFIMSAKYSFAINESLYSHYKVIKELAEDGYSKYLLLLERKERNPKNMVLDYYDELVNNIVTTTATTNTETSTTATTDIATTATTTTNETATVIPATATAVPATATAVPATATAVPATATAVPATATAVAVPATVIPATVVAVSATAVPATAVGKMNRIWFLRTPTYFEEYKLLKKVNENGYSILADNNSFHTSAMLQLLFDISCIHQKKNTLTASFNFLSLPYLRQIFKKFSSPLDNLSFPTEITTAKKHLYLDFNGLVKSIRNKYPSCLKIISTLFSSLKKSVFRIKIS